MDYKMFKECILEGLKERFGKDSQIEYVEVLKNNGIKLDGILLRKEKGITPTVYVNDFYDEYEEDLEEIIDRMESLIRNNTIREDYDVDSLIEFEKIKDRVVYKLINFDKNEDLLKTTPHKKFLDLAVVYYISLDDDCFEQASILINNSHLKLWEKNTDEIDELARYNAPRLLKPELKSMKETLEEMIRPGCFDEDEEFGDELFDDSDDCGMYVLTNEKKLFGASALLYDNVIKDFADKMKSGLYILPSSVHEVIMVPEKFVNEASMLDDMIVEVNETQVPKVDVLSDHSYYYSIEKGFVSCAS